MSTKDDIRSITYLKSRAADLLEQLNREGRPVIITQNGEARAVMLDPASYDEMRRSLGLLKLLAQGEQAVEAGKTEKQEDLFARLEKKHKGGSKRNGGSKRP